MFVTNDDHAPSAPRERERLRALDDYAVFDTPPDVDLDRLVELAARMYGTPVAALSLVGKERLYFKSRYGMEATGLGREGSFCSYAIENDGLFLVPDTCMDERFASHRVRRVGSDCPRVDVRRAHRDFPVRRPAMVLLAFGRDQGGSRRGHPRAAGAPEEDQAGSRRQVPR